MTEQVNEKMDVVAVGPHSDDVEICCGGIIARLCQQKYKVAIVDLTEAELSTRGDVESRKIEAANAAKALGVTHRENLEIPNGEIYECPEQERIIVQMLRRLRPEMLLFPYMHARHPDHYAAHALIKRALFSANLSKYTTENLSKHFVPHVLMYEMRYEMDFSFLVDISDLVSVKEEALKCFKSQMYFPDSSEEEEARGPSSFLYTAAASRAIFTRSAYYGSMIGVEHAEPLASFAAMGVSDPLAFMRQEVSCGANYIYPKRSI